MYLPRSLISKLYQHLLVSHHSQSPIVLILVALEPDALCACRILTALLKGDLIQFQIHPICGYDDLERVGRTQVKPMRTQDGGSGGVVVCLGVGGLVDMCSTLGLEYVGEEDGCGGVEVWLIDARRPWNIGNIFGGNPQDVPPQGGGRSERNRMVDRGRIQQSYRPGQGGIVVYDDGDIEEDLGAEGEAFFALREMEDVAELGDESDLSDHDSADGSDEGTFDRPRTSKKRKSGSEGTGEDEYPSDEEHHRSRRRRRSHSGGSIPAGHLNGALDRRGDRTPPFSDGTPPPRQDQPSPRAMRRKFKHLRNKHESVLRKYYASGSTYSEPISSIVYSLAEDLGREDNDLLWHGIVGVSSLELYGRSMAGVGISTALDSGGSAGWGGARGERIRQALRDEVHRLNPPDPNDTSREFARGESSGVIPTTGRSPADHSIRLSPEPRFLLIRHWSLYDSMLHSPYLGSRLHIWNDVGRKRLHKLLAKMGVSLSQCKQSYTHMDMDLKRGLRQKLLTYAPIYGLDGLVPPPTSSGRGRDGWGFVRSWGWKACLSAIDVGVVVGAILEVGKSGVKLENGASTRGWDRNGGDQQELVDEDGRLESEEWVRRFWEAYDSLEE